jgi:flagellar biosynthesis/type III secretory pathway M-ring protein FliF/YscJ
MVSTMVKKATPTMPAPAPATPAAPPRNVLGAEIVAGEAAEGGTLLNAVEMDEESVRNQQMMEQVATLVDENPDTAASLVKRWMNQG